MNKKGFTLVELLATIIILGLLALLASTSVTKVLKESKGDLYKTQIKLVESAAEAWGAENIDKLPNNNECKFLTIGTLQDYGLIDKDITNPKTGEKIDNSINIKISTSKTGYGNEVINYEIDPDSIEGCSHAMPCTLISGDKNTSGSKYECEVKPGTKYNFYVLSKEDDGTTNLIMDRNMCDDGTPTAEGKFCSVAWNSDPDQSTNAYGPVTAMIYLHNATKSWTNIPSLNYIYNDKEMQGTTEADTSYTSFVSNNGVATITTLDGTIITTIGSKTEPLKARMPIYSSDTTKTEVANFNNNGYLFENLDDVFWYYDESTKPTNNISGIYGYWTLSSYADHSLEAWYVDSDGRMFSCEAGIASDNGVRPVINLKI